MPLPYFSSAIMAAVVSSYFSGPTPSGSGAVNTSPHRLQRRRSSSYTVAASGAWPKILTSVRGSGDRLCFFSSLGSDRRSATRDEVLQLSSRLCKKKLGCVRGLRAFPWSASRVDRRGGGTPRVFSFCGGGG